MAPTILFVPGFWEGPTAFDQVSSLLQSDGYSTKAITLPSTGKVSPGNPSMEDDIAAIRSVVAELVDAGKDVAMVMHSGGGFLGSSALQGLTAKSHLEKGLKGGVAKIIFLSGAIFPEGSKHESLPFYTVEGGAMHCLTPDKLLFNDLEPAVAEKWVNALQLQPAEGWNGTVTYCGWREVPSVYLVCEGDQMIPPPMQVQIGEMAGSKMEKCGAGHMPHLSMPEKVADVVKGAIEAA